MSVTSQLHSDLSQAHWNDLVLLCSDAKIILSVLPEVNSLKLFIQFLCQSKGEAAHFYATNEKRSNILLSDYIYIKYLLMCNLSDNSA